MSRGNLKRAHFQISIFVNICLRVLLQEHALPLSDKFNSVHHISLHFYPFLFARTVQVFRLSQGFSCHRLPPSADFLKNNIPSRIQRMVCFHNCRHFAVGISSAILSVFHRRANNQLSRTLQGLLLFHDKQLSALRFRALGFGLLNLFLSSFVLSSKNPKSIWLICTASIPDILQSLQGQLKQLGEYGQGLFTVGRRIFLPIVRP
nr:MAG TPA: hypothetical protein [Caudoviricetes sp.]